MQIVFGPLDMLTPHHLAPFGHLHLRSGHTSGTTDTAPAPVVLDSEAAE